jgi:hypothetical protein
MLTQLLKIVVTVATLATRSAWRNDLVSQGKSDAILSASA